VAQLSTLGSIHTTQQTTKGNMKQIVSILFVGLFAVGCTTPRYDVRATSTPGHDGVDNSLVLLIDRQTGQVWYSQSSYSNPSFSAWKPLPENPQLIKK